MSLKLAITSFEGWTNKEQMKEFLEHFLGSGAATSSATVTSSTSLDKMTLQDLKDECKRLGIKGITGKTKPELREKIANYDPEASAKKAKKTKEYEIPEGFVKAEFVETFRADAEGIKNLDLKKAIKVFQVPDDSEDNGKFNSFGKSKVENIAALTKFFDESDLDEICKQEAPPTRPPIQLSDSEASSEESSGEDSVKSSKKSKKSDEAKAAKKAAKAEAKAAAAKKVAEAKAAAAKKAAEDAESSEDSDSEDDDEPVEPEVTDITEDAEDTEEPVAEFNAPVEPAADSDDDETPLVSYKADAGATKPKPKRRRGGKGKKKTEEKPTEEEKESDMESV